MKNFIRVKDRYYILAQSSLAENKTSVLKSGDMFAVFRHNGDIGDYGLDQHGIYFEGTRYLSKFMFTVEGRHPLLLSSVVKDDNEFLAIDLTNPDIPKSDGERINKGDLHFLRKIFLKKHVFYEELRITNYGLKPMEFNF